MSICLKFSVIKTELMISPLGITFLLLYKITDKGCLGGVDFDSDSGSQFERSCRAHLDDSGAAVWGD